MLGRNQWSTVLPTCAALALVAPGGAGAASLTPVDVLAQPAPGPVTDLAFDRTGRHLYATNGHGYGPVYSSLRRDVRSGALRSRHAGTCDHRPGLSGRSCRTAAQIEVSADGRNAYVLGVYTYVSAVTALTRSPQGVLAPTNRFVASLGRSVTSFVLSPDGRDVYVAAGSSVVRLDRARDGTLRRTKGYEGCHTGRGGCPLARGVANAVGIALSADGRSLYVLSETGVAAFRRNLRSGALRQLPGGAGCIALDASSGCAVGRALDNGHIPTAGFGGKLSGRRLVISRDGMRVYAATKTGIAVLARSTVDGSLRQPAGAAGCVAQDAATGCTPVRALRGVAALAVAPDGGTLYATTASQSLVVLRRDAATHGLLQPAGAEGCVNAAGAERCMAVPALRKPFAVAVSPDGRHLYVGSLSGPLLGFAT
jgi:DNA-binding beta-propeller fold protein YncE